MKDEKFNELIKQAKEVPIQKVLNYFDWQIDGNVCRCPSPLHEDSHPSAIVNPKYNKVFCPVCRTNEDTIATYRNLSQKVNHETVPFIDACYRIATLGHKPSLSSSVEDDIVEELLDEMDCDDTVAHYLKLSHNLVLDDFKYLSTRGLQIKGDLRNALTQNHVTLRSLLYGGSWCTSFYFSFEYDGFCSDGQKSFFFCRSRTDNGKYNIGSSGFKLFYSHIKGFNFLQRYYPVFVVEGIFDAMSILQVNQNIAVLCLNSCANAKKLMNYMEGHGRRTGKLLYVLALDNDKAGEDTTKELSRFMEEHGMMSAVFKGYGDCKDLNELCLSLGREEFNKILEENRARVRALWPST